ncbi:hypothetical protein [Pseudophaeobacter sp.]|uniref:hypothetical protein n=1 Tax=Pseudophaeobacter sp. TaxID=1971739 RepID=UPI00329A46C4
MTSIFVDYSKFEIARFDHLRALTGPRTRQAPAQGRISRRSPPPPSKLNELPSRQK